MSGPQGEAGRGVASPSMGAATVGPEDGRPRETRALHRLSRRAALASGAAGAALLLEAALPDATPVAEALTSPPNTNTFYPEDFGAKGDGTTDDTAAIQACIDTVVVDGSNAVIQFGPKMYLVNGTPRHDRKGNAVVALPDVVGHGTVRLQGVQEGTVIRSTLTGQSYSSSYGCPSILGGPTPEQMAVGQFANFNIEIADIRFTTVVNPTLCGIDLSRTVRCKVQNVYVQTDNPAASPQPASVYSFGLRLPEGLNYGRLSADEVDVNGFYAGIVCNTDHTQIRHTISKWCVLGVGLTGGTGHASLFNCLTTEWCTSHIAAWSPTVGAQSLPTGASNAFYLVIDLWDIEDAPSGNWYSTFAHLADNNNQIHGRANYLRVKSNVGVQPGPLNIGGGAHFTLTDLSS